MLFLHVQWREVNINEEDLRSPQIVELGSVNNYVWKQRIRVPGASDVPSNGTQFIVNRSTLLLQSKWRLAHKWTFIPAPTGYPLGANQAFPRSPKQSGILGSG